MHARKLIVVVALAALGATACGSSSKTAASNEPTTTKAAGSSSGADTTTTAGKDFSGSGSGDFCGLMKDDAAAFESADLASKSPKEIKNLYSDIVPALEKAKGKAPDEIKEDMGILVDAFKSLVDALNKVDYDFTKLTPDSFKDLSNPKYETASDNITKYLSSVCHITSTT